MEKKDIWKAKYCIIYFSCWQAPPPFFSNCKSFHCNLKIWSSIACYAFLLSWEKFHETIIVFCAYTCAWAENWRRKNIKLIPVCRKLFKCPPVYPKQIYIACIALWISSTGFAFSEKYKTPVPLMICINAFISFFVFGQ